MNSISRILICQWSICKGYVGMWPVVGRILSAGMDLDLISSRDSRYSQGRQKGWQSREKGQIFTPGPIWHLNMSNTIIVPTQQTHFKHFGGGRAIELSTNLHEFSQCLAWRRLLIGPSPQLWRMVSQFYVYLPCFNWESTSIRAFWEHCETSRRFDDNSRRRTAAEELPAEQWATKMARKIKLPFANKQSGGQLSDPITK